jgi:hypothetical protein
MLRSRDGGKTWGERQVIGGIPMWMSAKVVAFS